MASSYTGPVRIYGGDGIFLTTGVAALEPDEGVASWKGLVQTLRGTAVNALNEKNRTGRKRSKA